MSISLSLSLSLSLFVFLSLCLCVCQVVCFAFGISGGEWRRMKGLNFGGFWILDAYFSCKPIKKLNFLIFGFGFFFIYFILCSSCSSLPCDWVDQTFCFVGQFGLFCLSSTNQRIMLLECLCS